MSIAEDSLRQASLYEAELLLELMLRYWGHPHQDDHEYRNSLLEAAIEVLTQATHGTRFIKGLPPNSMNLVAAIWYVEWNTLENGSESVESVHDQRQLWVDAVQRSIPGCFCDPDDLQGEM